jgi:hypothetical protein
MLLEARACIALTQGLELGPVRANLLRETQVRRPIVCVCLLLQDLVQRCWRGGGGDMGRHVL